jgi:hypothetical protein
VSAALDVGEGAVDGAVAGAGAGADVVGVVELGAVVVGADVVEVALGSVEGDGVVVVDAPVVPVTSAPATEADMTMRPKTARVAADSAPRRARAVLCAGRELARIGMISELGGWSDVTAEWQQTCERVRHSLVVVGPQVND